jgi:hypothetical protein
MRVRMGIHSGGPAITHTARRYGEPASPRHARNQFTARIQKIVTRILIAFTSGKFLQTASELCSPNQLII